MGADAEVEVDVWTVDDVRADPEGVSRCGALPFPLSCSGWAAVPVGSGKSVSFSASALGSFVWVSPSASADCLRRSSFQLLRAAYVSGRERNQDVPFERG